MEASISVGLLWTLFALTHVGLATTPIRRRLVARLGEPGFTFAYSLVAVLGFALVVAVYATQRFEGLRGPSLGALAVLRWMLLAVIAIGVSLMTGSFATYHRSPYTILGHERFVPPRGLERVTRHPFFAGLALFALAHALLATHLVGTVFVAGFAVVAVVGSWHQDRKLLSRLGSAFEARLRETSAIPFAAIVVGRQRLVWSELPLGAMALGLALTLGLRAAHDGIFAWSGAPFVLSTAGAAAVILVVSLRRRPDRPQVGSLPRRERLRA